MQLNSKLKLFKNYMANHIQETKNLILIGQEQYNYFVILCKKVKFRAEFVISFNYNHKANKPIKM